MGQGLIKQFAQAAVLRDKRRDYLGAFKTVAGCITGLLQKQSDGWLANLIQPARHPEMRPIRREIWTFTRDPDLGLPASSLVARSSREELQRGRVWSRPSRPSMARLACRSRDLCA